MTANFSFAHYQPIINFSESIASTSSIIFVNFEFLKVNFPLCDYYKSDANDSLPIILPIINLHGVHLPAGS